MKVRDPETGPAQDPGVLRKAIIPYEFAIIFVLTGWIQQDIFSSKKKVRRTSHQIRNPAVSCSLLLSSIFFIFRSATNLVAHTYE